MRVNVVGGDFAVVGMFLKNGWTTSLVPDDSNLIVFTGGADVDPALYGEERHPATYSSPKRDSEESHIYHQWVGKVPMAGICRGGQLLNVLNGGKMWQHINNHIGKHMAFDHVHEKPVEVTSTHHQMMIPSESGKVILTASESSVRYTADKLSSGPFEDVEAVYYKDTKCLCFQPHPEYVNINHECQTLFFEYLEKIV